MIVVDDGGVGAEYCGVWRCAVQGDGVGCAILGG